MGNTVKNEAHDALTGLLWEPLLASLQDPTIISSERCQHCQPELPVNIVSVNRSGSGAEGLSDVKVGRGGTSDFDVMFEFGCPFNWAGAGAEPAIISPQSAPQLWAKPTDNIGFVTLHWVPTTECRHTTALDAFPTNSLRALMLNIGHVMTNGTNWQQCYMLMAWSVLDRQDLAGGKQPTSPSDEVVTVDAAPLMAILTASDLKIILGDPAAVSAWCRQQLQRPPGERPGGLTADLDTPRGRVELLLQPELLLQAVREAVPQKVEFWKSRDDAMGRGWMVNYFPPRTYHERLSMVMQHLDQDLRGTLGRIRPDLDGTTLDAKAKIWRRELEDLRSGHRLRRAVDAASRWPDNWNLAQFYVAKDTGKTHRPFGGAGAVRSRAQQRAKTVRAPAEVLRQIGGRSEPVKYESPLGRQPGG
ncbi:hypothetical protein FJT64_014425 [Amphibalanus amphitrite]|uniref:Uncharacterized protein n=1 Tax=Amphibalanus amphitrite TaxID=1232801 RepID=A0A6A4V7G2_AMPAM|nr:hypothetical protein FJT64_014425 [Amphibalanus amphitrite]